MFARAVLAHARKERFYFEKGHAGGTSIYCTMCSRGSERAERRVGKNVTEKKEDKETRTRFPATYFSQKRLLKF